MPRILIADDHAIVRKGLVQILTEAPEAFVIDESGSGEEAIAKAAHNDYDLVILDISMPGKGGLEVLKELKDHNTELPVLMLSMQPEDQYAVRALRSGASGYVTKGSAADELVGAIRKILAGGRYISSSLAENLVYGLISDEGRPLHEALSVREDQVMRMIAAGKATREIARELSLNVKTVSTFRTRLLHKMKMKSNAELTHYAIQKNLLD